MMGQPLPKKQELGLNYLIGEDDVYRNPESDEEMQEA